MRLLLKYTACLWLFVVVIFYSCKRELSCEGCKENNKPPTAIAGPDQVITMPPDSVLLDGSASTDPDGAIVKYEWIKISGPGSFTIVSRTSSKTIVQNLNPGIYQFELIVTDNGGLTSRDEVQITLTDPSNPNRSPVANAGPDQIITLPINIVYLSGAGSTDPDNNIITYTWSQISGPGINFTLPINAIQLQVPDLFVGTYQFELKVTDAGALFSRDTVKVIVNDIMNSNCDISNRTVIIAQLIPVGTLSEARAGMAVATAGNKILFAGGGYVPGSPTSSRVDIFNITSGSWTNAELSQARWGIATAVLNDKIFFAGGGGVTSGNYYDNVDVFDVLTNSWSLSHLSEPRALLAGSSIGSKIFFAGGTSNTIGLDANNKVDIYNLSTSSWSTTVLSEGRFDLSGITVGTKIYFAGGSDNAANSIDNLDIYDNANDTWSTTYLQFVGDGATSIAVDDNIYWTGFAFNGQTSISKVEIKNVITGNTSAHCLSYTRYRPGVALKDNKIVFFTGANIWGELKNKIDIYNITTGAWSIGVLPVNIEGASVISVNNTIYIAGGIVNGIVSNQVWKLDF